MIRRSYYIILINLPAIKQVNLKISAIFLTVQKTCTFALFTITKSTIVLYYIALHCIAFLSLGLVFRIMMTILENVTVNM